MNMPLLDPVQAVLAIPLLGAALLVLLNDYRWSARLNVDNLLDKKHFGMYSAYGAITYGAPRNVNLTLKYQF